MAVLKIVINRYENTNAIANLVNYVLNEEKMPHGCWGGKGISLYAPAETMYAVKNIYDKTTGKQAEHFILAFSKEESAKLTFDLIYKIAYDICNLLGNVQVLFGLHEVRNTYFSDDYDDDSVHLHFVVNTVELQTGKKFRLDFSNEYYIKDCIYEILKSYNISETIVMVNKKYPE